METLGFISLRIGVNFSFLSSIDTISSMASASVLKDKILKTS